MSDRAKRPNGKAEPHFVESKQLWQVFVELPIGADGKRRRKAITAKTANAAKRRAKELRIQMDAGA